MFSYFFLVKSLYAFPVVSSVKLLNEIFRKLVCMLQLCIKVDWVNKIFFYCNHLLVICLIMRMQIFSFSQNSQTLKKIRNWSSLEYFLNQNRNLKLFNILDEDLTKMPGKTEPENTEKWSKSALKNKKRREAAKVNENSKKSIRLKNSWNLFF